MRHKRIIEVSTSAMEPSVFFSQTASFCMQGARKETLLLNERDIKVEIDTWQEIQEKQSINISLNELKEKLFNCLYCGKIFLYEFNLNKHKAERHSSESNNGGQSAPLIQTHSTNINCNAFGKELWDKAMSVNVKELFDCSYCGEVFYKKFNLIDHEAICRPPLSVGNSQNDSDQGHFKTVAQRTQQVDICIDELKKEPLDEVISMDTEELINQHGLDGNHLEIKKENKIDEMQLQESIDIDVDSMKKELGEILLDAEETFNCSYCGSIFDSESSLINHEVSAHPPLEADNQSPLNSIDAQESNDLVDSDDSIEVVYSQASVPADSDVQFLARRSNTSHLIDINTLQSKKLLEEAIDKYSSDKLKSLQASQRGGRHFNQGQQYPSTSAELVKPLLTFTCIICLKTFGSKSLILEHVKEKHNERILKCDECDFQTLHENQMQEHLKIHPKIHQVPDEIEEILEINSKIDEKTGEDGMPNNLEIDGKLGEENMEKDLKIDEKSDQSKLQDNSEAKSDQMIYLKPECDICKRTYSHMSTYKKHYRTFHANPVPKYVCDLENCRYVTHVEDRLTEHKIRRHSKVSKDLLPCTVANCVATFKYQSHLKIHILHRHVETLESYFECDICHKRFEQKFKLIKHLEIHNKKKVKLYKCKACSITFHSTHHYEKHFFSVHKSAKFSCKYCDDKFINRNKLWSHINLKHLKPATTETFECHKCNKKFKTRKTLEKHLKPSSGKTFDCPDCQKKFKSKMSMDRHMKNHSESYVECDHCGYQTKQKELLQRHMIRKHTKKYNFKCTEPGCGKKFKLNFDYKWHVKKYHDTSVTG